MSVTVNKILQKMSLVATTLKQHNTFIGQIKMGLSSILTKLQQIIASRQLFQKQLNDNQAKYKDLSIEIKQKDTIIAKLEEERNKLLGQIRIQQQKQQALDRQQQQQLQQQYQQQRIQDQDQLTQLKQQYRSATRSLDTKIKTNEDEIIRLSQQLKDCNARLQAASNGSAVANQQLRELQDENINLKQIINQFNAQINEIKQLLEEQKLLLDPRYENNTENVFKEMNEITGLLNSILGSTPPDPFAPSAPSAPSARFRPGLDDRMPRSNRSFSSVQFPNVSPRPSAPPRLLPRDEDEDEDEEDKYSTNMGMGRNPRQGAPTFLPGQPPSAQSFRLNVSPETPYETQMNLNNGKGGRRKYNRTKKEKRPKKTAAKQQTKERKRKRKNNTKNNTKNNRR